MACSLAGSSLRGDAIYQSETDPTLQCLLNSRIITEKTKKNEFSSAYLTVVEYKKTWAL